MDRRFLFPALAATAWAQQAPQPAIEALRDRAQQYYQLMVDKKYRQAETMVAEDSREDYYNGKKPDIKAFEIMKIDMLTSETAIVTIRAKVLMLMPGAGAQIFDMPTPTNWKLEKGVWSWYVPDEVRNATPFGRMQNSGDQAAGIDMKGAAPGSLTNPDINALVNKIGIDRISVVLSAKEPSQVVTVTNGLAGPLTLEIDSRVRNIKGIEVTLSSPQVEGGGKATVTIRKSGDVKVADFVTIIAEPFHRIFNVQVRSE